MDILLAIRPRYVQFMRDGKKKVELRRVMRTMDVDRIYIYESSPVKMITACLESLHIEKMQIDELWTKTRYISCIPKESFYTYFRGKKEGTGIFFDKFIALKPLSLDLVGASVPQNYVLLDKLQATLLEKTHG